MMKLEVMREATQDSADKLASGACNARLVVPLHFFGGGTWMSDGSVTDGCA
jgi:hypothetical protein